MRAVTEVIVRVGGILTAHEVAGIGLVDPPHEVLVGHVHPRVQHGDRHARLALGAIPGIEHSGGRKAPLTGQPLTLHVVDGGIRTVELIGGCCRLDAALHGPEASQHLGRKPAIDLGVRDGTHPAVAVHLRALLALRDRDAPQAVHQLRFLGHPHGMKDGERPLVRRIGAEANEQLTRHVITRRLGHRERARLATEQEAYREYSQREESIASFHARTSSRSSPTRNAAGDTAGTWAGPPADRSPYARSPNPSLGRAPPTNSLPP
ncbi:hypothetical protein D3C86_1160190 [compost metagenome]